MQVKLSSKSIAVIDARIKSLKESGVPGDPSPTAVANHIIENYNVEKWTSALAAELKKAKK